MRLRGFVTHFAVVALAGSALAAPCTHDPCYQGDNLVSTCSPCVTQICNTNPFCCEEEWGLACALATESTCEQTCAPLCGDANDDRRVSAADALAALRTAVGGGSCSELRCDFNGDGQILAGDALLILRAAVGAPSAAACPATNKYVLDSVEMPITTTQRNAFAFDLDKDGNGDNQFGAVIQVLASQGVDFQTGVDSAVSSGSTVELAALATGNLVTAANARWRFFAGEPADSPPNFDGSDVFTVAENGAMLAPLDGTITAGLLAAQLPEGAAARIVVEIALVLGQPPVRLELAGGHVAANVTANACTNGRMGGAITVDDLNSEFVPAFATQLEESIPEECRPGAAKGDYSMCESDDASVLQLFDIDPRDGHISIDEVRENNLIEAILTPDVDLLDSSGAYNPNTDEEPDSISFAFGFTCVAATFDE